MLHIYLLMLHQQPPIADLSCAPEDHRIASDISLSVTHHLNPAYEITIFVKNHCIAPE